MKTKSIAILLFLLISCYTIAQTQVQSSPIAPPELMAHYNRDIYSLALNRIFEVNAPATSNIEIPAVYCDTIKEALACVYNAFPFPERDSVFDIHCIHNHQSYYYDVTHFIYLTSTYFPHYFAWSNYSIFSGDIAIDTLLNNYGFEVVDFHTYNNMISAHFSTSQNINTYALLNYINASPNIVQGQAWNGYYGGPSKKIFYSKDQTYRYLDFRIAWGDCYSGCTDFKDYHFRVTENNIVEYTGFTLSPPSNTYYPNYSNCAISNIPLFSYENSSFCQGDSLFINNQWVSGPLVHNDTVLSSIGTDSIIFYNITVNPAYDNRLHLTSKCNF